MRKLFRRSEVRKWITDDPTADLKIRSGGGRFAVPITVAQYQSWLQVASTTGDDPELDRLLLELIRQTTLRQEGLVNLTLDAIDVAGCRLRASAKYGLTQDVPANRHLLEAILQLALARGSSAGSDPAFRYRDGSPLTGKRFDTLSRRLKTHQAWAAPLRIGPHAIRRLTLTAIERRHGMVDAAVWANHSWEGQPTTFQYIAAPDWPRLRQVAEDLFGPLDAPMPSRPTAAGGFATPYGIPPEPTPGDHAFAAGSPGGGARQLHSAARSRASRDGARVASREPSAGTTPEQLPDVLTLHDPAAHAPAPVREPEDRPLFQKGAR